MPPPRRKTQSHHHRLLFILSTKLRAASGIYKYRFTLIRYFKVQVWWWYKISFGMLTWKDYPTSTKWRFILTWMSIQGIGKSRDRSVVALTHIKSYCKWSRFYWVWWISRSPGPRVKKINFKRIGPVSVTFFYGICFISLVIFKNWPKNAG